LQQLTSVQIHIRVAYLGKIVQLSLLMTPSNLCNLKVTIGGKRERDRRSRFSVKVTCEPKCGRALSLSDPATRGCDVLLYVTQPAQPVG
jgi:hypothetical protein